MKIFYITADFELSEKPDWLDAFRVTYDDPYAYHITLKQGTYFEENRLEEIEACIQKIIVGYSPIILTFDNVHINKTPKGQVIMIKAEPNTTLSELQHRLSQQLASFGEIIAPYYKEYEDHFDPHITIARHLTDEQLEVAKKELGNDVVCQATIHDIVLKTNPVTSHLSLIYPDYSKTFTLT